MLNEDFTKDEQKELILTNIIEELVKQSVDSVLPTMDMCNCEICRLNACAIALNALTPHYVTTTKGGIMARISIEPRVQQIQVLVETTKALMMVKKHPLH